MLPQNNNFVSSYEQLSTLLLTTLKTLTLISPDISRLAIGSAINNRKASNKDHALLDNILAEVFPSNLLPDFIDSNELKKSVQRLQDDFKPKSGD